jgi:hypothetical protein
MPDDDIREQPSRFSGVTAARLGDRFNFSKVSWGAIWGGVMVTIGMEALFIAFGLFIDGVLGGSDPWSIAWYLVTACVSFYIGGHSAARLSNIADKDICILHGLSTWGLATLATLLIEGVVWFAALLRTPLNTGFAWGPTELYGGVIWGGVILGLITAYAGSASGIPRVAVQTSAAQLPQEGLRRAS